MAWSWKKLLGLGGGTRSDDDGPGRPARLASGTHASLESELVHEVVGLFVHEFGIDARTLDAHREVAAPRQDRIGAQDIAEMCNALNARPVVGPPDLLVGLDEERLWILVDLARTASERAQVAAKLELTDVLSATVEKAGIDKAIALRVLVTITQAAANDDCPKVWHELITAARGASDGGTG